MLNKIAMRPFDPLPVKNYFELHENESYLVTAMKLEDVETSNQRIVFELNSEFEIILPSRITRALLKHYSLYIIISENIQKYQLFLEYHGGDRFKFDY